MPTHKRMTKAEARAWAALERAAKKVQRFTKRRPKRTDKPPRGNAIDSTVERGEAVARG